MTNKTTNKIKQFFKGLFKRQYLNLSVVNELNKRGVGVYF